MPRGKADPDMEKIMLLLRKLILSHEEFTWHELRLLFTEAGVEVPASDSGIHQKISNGLSSLQRCGLIEKTVTRGRWRSKVALTAEGLISIDWDEVCKPKSDLA